MSRRANALLSLLVAAGVLTSTAANCVAGVLMPVDEQKVCLVTVHEHCPKTGAPADCCKKIEPRQPQLLTAKADVLKAPVRHVLAWLTPAVLPSALVDDVTLWSYVDTSPPISPKAPPYIRPTALRI